MEAPSVSCNTTRNWNQHDGGKIIQNPLELDTTTFGILVDGYEDTQYLPCTLTVGGLGKIDIEVSFPYMEPFNLSSSGEHLWVNGQPIPNRMSFLHSGGSVELFGIRFTGSSNSFYAAKTDRISCDVAFAIEGTVPQLGSEIPTFVSLRQTFFAPEAITPIPLHKLELGETDDSSSTVRTIAIPGIKDVWKWSSDAIDHVISLVPSVSHEPGRTEIKTRLEFQSFAQNPRDFQTLHTEQQKFVELMQIICNKQIPVITPAALLPNLEAPIYQRLRSGRVRTSLIRESAEREVKPCISTADLQQDALVQWYEKYPTYFRAISALSSLLPRIEIDAEERMINSFIALETIGHISLGHPFGGKREDTDKYVEECLRILGIQSVEFASSIKGFSKALAHNYNGIKHPRASTFPDVTSTFVFGLLAQGIARAALIKQSLGMEVDWMSMSEVLLAHAIVRQEKITIDDKGNF